MVIGQFIGGIGLFLLGMTLLTDGLKLAAGPALEIMLGRWTSTRWRALVSGLSITALVQSSSAVTVAALGFVNAGLLVFDHAVWVIFGSNVGTTLTAWLVALLGFSIKIDAYALPLVGVGAFLHLMLKSNRHRAIGTAIAGFGLLFLGIDIMKSAFEGLGAGISDGLTADGSFYLLWMVVVGAILTVLMQSSSAAIAVILTAIAGHLLPLEAGAAAVIGANIGTTSTAILASFGATASAKRLSVAHVLFNLITGLVALLLLPLFMWAVTELLKGESQAENPAVFLAAFHSLFNLLGVALMWPLGTPMIRWLKTRFQRGGKVLSLKHIDKNASVVPDLAFRAVRMELERFQGLLSAHIRASLLNPEDKVTEETRNALRELLDEINQYISNLLQQPLSASMANQIPDALQVVQYAYNLLETMDSLRKEPTVQAELMTQLNDWLVNHAFPSNLEPLDMLGTSKDADDSYQRLKQRLLDSAMEGRLGLSKMNQLLQRLSQYKRLQEQQIKAVRLLLDMGS
ncbi:Na+/phosphate symporter [Hahella sp. CCB-MM4]|uniref:Na/Pi cotransporter family protein n=1 Tax=Hahella sp. (strain CCB-MM4) TaxID=1926491 RepID=UPI000B9BA0C2|nr:Na/Pi symporter [Hahella sp. CCB-MM4]OZG73179.1 Na+/phosphate symporter [Hahella sp. CCB-MM4]